MIVPSVLIFSGSRSGSTTLYRALNLIPGSQLAYEPGFHDIELSAESVKARIRTLLEDYSGFKHVFDPTGYPFRDVDSATIEEMERDSALWIRLNAAVLNHPGLRIVFLRRRDEFQRIVSCL